MTINESVLGNIAPRSTSRTPAGDGTTAVRNSLELAVRLCAAVHTDTWCPSAIPVIIEPPIADFNVVREQDLAEGHHRPTNTFRDEGLLGEPERFMNARFSAMKGGCSDLGLIK